MVGLLLLSASGHARPSSRAVLVGAAGDSAVQRLENELRAAGHAVVVASDAVASTEPELSELARQRGAQAIVRIDGPSSAREVVVFIVGSAGRELTLRRLTLRSRPGEDADGVLALRVVEIVNAALQELDRHEAPAPRQPQAPAPRVTPAPAAPARTRLSVAGGVRALWFAEALPPLLGPELAGRARAPWGLFGEATGFVSASRASFARASGTASFRAFSAGLKLGYAGALSRRLDWAAWLGAAWLLSWADATPAAGYRATAGLARAALLHGGAELSMRLSRWTRLSAALDAGAVVPRYELSMAGVPVANARWLGGASLGVAMEWEP